MKGIGSMAFGLVLALVAASARAQSVLFDFNAGPPNTGTPLDQISSGIRAHFSATNEVGYAIWPAGTVGVVPTGFDGYSLCPASVYLNDLRIAFTDQTTGAGKALSSISLLAAPQELACDSSSTMRITAFLGSTQVGTTTAIAPPLDTYMWPTITLSFSSADPFDRVVIHFEAGPPTGGDWGPIFAIDNVSVTPAEVVTGTVSLQNYLASAVAGTPVTVEIRSVGSTIPIETHSATLTSSGQFTVTTAVAPGTYDVAVKASHWLRQTMGSVTFDAAGASGLSFSLLNGDINGDNVVSLADFALLRTAYGSVPGNANWNANADLNGDGAVSLADFAIMRGNYGQQGNP